jgi:hypothetical protein
VSEETIRKKRLRPGLFIATGAIVIGIGVLSWPLWPDGSDNMFVTTDNTAVEAIVVCSDSGEVLWRIVASPHPVEGLRRVPYGSLPEGFKQQVPSAGPPRLFKQGEPLQVHVLSGTRDMGDGGHATGPREFRTVVNFGGPRPSSPSAVECARPR